MDDALLSELSDEPVSDDDEPVVEAELPEPVVAEAFVLAGAEAVEAVLAVKTPVGVPPLT